jgi:Ca2+-binding RTX toxin-like protein
MVSGDRGRDHLDGGSAGDYLFGKAGGDLLVGDEQKVISTVGDRLFGGRGRDELRGGHGRDQLWGGPGGDDMRGGRDHRGSSHGPDVVIYANSPSPVTVRLDEGRATGEGRDTIRGVGDVIGSDFADSIFTNSAERGHINRRINHVNGGPGNDLIVGAEGWDHMSGGDGDDTLRGLRGLDRLAGDEGNDLLFGGRDRDSLGGGEGDDVIVGGAGQDEVSYVGTEGPVTVDLTAGTAEGDGTDTLASIEGILGSDFDDVLIGNDAVTVIVGLGGSDSITGGEGDDFLVGGSSIGVEFGRRWCDTEPLDEADFIQGEAGNDVVMGCEGDDALEGNGGGDELAGGAGDDVLDGGVGSDLASFDDLPPLAADGVVADLALGTSTAEGLGTDTLVAIENLRGTSLNDTFRGDDGDNRIDGSFDDDLIEGRGGNDFLDGGFEHPQAPPKFDRLDGGDGTDTCINGEEVVNCEQP